MHNYYQSYSFSLVKGITWHKLSEDYRKLNFKKKVITHLYFILLFPCYYTVLHHETAREITLVVKVCNSTVTYMEIVEL